MKRLLLVGCGVLALGISTHVSRAQTNISSRADTILRSACDFLAQSREFTLNAEVWHEHVDDSGQKIQFGRSIDMDVKRPNALRVEITSPMSARGLWYDGKSLTILDRKHNWYSSTSMPDTLDKAADAVHDQGIDIPLIDLALKDPYQNAIAKVQSGRYYGIATVLGIACHHLAFTQDNVDWQIWIEDRPQPLIRKFIITYKNEPGSPEFTALITHWNFTDSLPDSNFKFVRPSGATQIETRTDGSGVDTNK